jgi:hypothetical protein
MVPDMVQPTEEIRSLCTLVAGDLFEVRNLVLTELERYRRDKPDG